MKHLAVFLSGLAAVLAVPAFAAGSPVLEAVSGSDGCKLIRAGKTEAADEGDELQTGDRVQVGAKAAVRILFGDGTHVTLSGGTDAEIARPLAGAAGLVLHKGNLSAHVAKPPAPVAPKAGAPADLRFYIKTNAAVMGVRGTEFVVDHDDASGTEVHTLHGLVEVAKDDDDLHQGRGQRLRALDRVRADKAGLGKTGRFDKAAFGRERGKHHHLAADLGKKGLRSRDDLRQRVQARQKERADRAGKGMDGKAGPGDGRGRDGASGKPGSGKAEAGRVEGGKRVDRPGKPEGGRADKPDHRERRGPGRRDRD